MYIVLQSFLINDNYHYYYIIGDITLSIFLMATRFVSGLIINARFFCSHYIVVIIVILSLPARKTAIARA